MKVYISGPIKGYPNGNREAFAARVESLTTLGFTAVNPHDVEPKHAGPCRGEALEGKAHRYGCYLAADIAVLLVCDMITTLPGWQTSTGAKVEMMIAKAVGIPVLS